MSKLYESFYLQFRHEGLPHLSWTIYPAVTQLTTRMLGKWLRWRKHVPSILVHSCQYLLLPETFNLIFRQRILHSTNSVLHSSKFIDLFGNQISMFVKIFLSITRSSLRLLQKDKLSFKITIMLVINHRSLNSKIDVIHERSLIGTKISMTITLRKFLLRLLYSLLFLLRLLVLSLLDDMDIRFCQSEWKEIYFY